MTRLKPKIYAQALYEVCQQTKDVDAVLKKFVALLARHNRLSAVKQIIKEFTKLYNLNQSNRDVLVETVQKLDDDSREKIIKLVKDLANVKSVQLTEKINLELLGGIKLSIDDLQIDGSLKGTLNLLKINLTKT